MLEFNSTYFAEEERCGFIISQKMKRAWAAEMEVLSEVIRICKKYNLTYYADWGTLLGAVRHKGYVPWDDDLDITLKRKDYQKLLSVLPDELPEGYHVSSVYTPGEHNQPLSFVMNHKTILTDPSDIEKFHGCPYIAGVDIAPLDYVPRDEELAETQRMLYSVVYDAAHRYRKLKQNGELKEYIPQIEQLCSMSFDYSRPLRRQLWVLCDQISGLYQEEECDDLTWFPRTVVSDKKYRYKKEWYTHTVEMPFENIMVAVPMGYDHILTKMYGDYHKMEKRRCGHNYPFFASQDAFIEKLKQKNKNERTG